MVDAGPAGRSHGLRVIAGVIGHPRASSGGDRTEGRPILSIAPYDPRGIANILLDEADHNGIRLSHLALQKLVYFAHGLYLSETKTPLVSGYFEAWQHGPVHPAVYRAFQYARHETITFRAMRRDAMTGQSSPVEAPCDAGVAILLEKVIKSLGQLSTGKLVDISHVKNGPWHFVVDKGRTSVVLGLRISDDVIRERFKYHKVAVGSASVSGEPSEDAPFA